MAKRLTSKKFLEFINSEFKRFEMDYIVATEVIRTYYTTDQYERGACKLKVRIKDTRFEEELYPTYFNCFFSLGEYQDHINNGYEMYLRFNDGNFFRDLEVELRKKKTI